MAPLPDYYEVLQVSPNAEVEIIQAAYKRLAFKCHPDRRPGDPSASEQMKLVNDAYEILSNPHKRREYDLRRRQSATSGAAAEAARQAAEQRKRAEEERQQEEGHQRQEDERKRQEQERQKREAEAAWRKRQEEDAGSEANEKAVGGRIAAAVAVSLVCYGVLGAILPLTVAGAIVKMVGVITIGVMLLRWAEAGSRAASNLFRTELYWAVLFAADGGLGIYNGYLSEKNLELGPARITTDLGRLVRKPVPVEAKVLVNDLPDDLQSLTNPANWKPAQTGTYLDELPDEYRPKAPPPWEEVADKFTSAFPDLDPGDMQKRYEQCRQLIAARQAPVIDLQREQNEWFIRRSVPFLSAGVNLAEAQGYSTARQRFAEGAPRPEDYRVIADYERIQKQHQERNKTWGGAFFRSPN
jgi:hypothetical protein